MIQPIVGITNITNATPATGGTDREDDQKFESKNFRSKKNYTYEWFEDRL